MSVGKKFICFFSSKLAENSIRCTAIAGNGSGINSRAVFHGMEFNTLLPVALALEFNFKK